MSRDDQIRRSFRNAWLFVGLNLAFIAGWAALTYFANEPGRQPEWAMGARDFVPAQSRYGHPYPVVVAPEEER